MNMWCKERQKEEEYKVNKEQKEGHRNDRGQSSHGCSMSLPGMAKAKPGSKRQRVSDTDFKRQV